MKLKYKKLVMFVSLGTLFLSFIILSMVPTGGSGVVDPEDAEVTQDENKEINDLITKYFNAKLVVDMDAMTDLVSDPNRIEQSKLVAQQEYIESYQNISCYVIANEEEDAFRVYVRYDMKIKNIDTLAPSLSGLYVTVTSDGGYRVYLSALDEEEEEFIQAADKNMEVIKLKEDVANKLNQAITADANFKQFYEQIEQQNAAAAQAQAQADAQAQAQAQADAQAQAQAQADAQAQAQAQADAQAQAQAQADAQAQAQAQVTPVPAQ